MNRKNKVLVFDLVAFCGGSKKATASILDETGIDKSDLVCLTKDPASWEGVGHHVYCIREPKYLSNAEQGLKYYLRQCILLFYIFLLHLRFGRFAMLIGSSGPGVDFALMVYRMLTASQYCQLIHGPVSGSRSIGFALRQTDFLGILESEKKSTYRALRKVLDRSQAREKILGRHTTFFQNGLPKNSWPTERQDNANGILWAASLLKWKGLQTLLEAVDPFVFVDNHPPIHICYIQPIDSLLEQDPAPKNRGVVHCYENPRNLDELRSQSSIFVSTSRCEPFGLSILEAMAAGLCVVIPEDGAYWDEHLLDGINCIKYPAGDVQALSHILFQLTQSPDNVKRIGSAGMAMAESYSAAYRYADVANGIWDRLRNPARGWVTP